MWLLLVGATLNFFKMKNLFFVGLLLLLNTFLYSQQIRFNWQQCYGALERDIAYDIISSDNGYLLLASQKQPPSSTNDGLTYIWLQKTDLIGNVLWEKYFSSSTTGAVGGRILKADNNSYFIEATTSGDGGDVTYDPYPDSKDFWIIKIDSSGNKLWDKIVGGAGYDQIMDIAVTIDGGIVIIGFIGSPDGNPGSYVGDASSYYGFWDFWVVKLDSDGNKVWDYTLGSTWAEWGITVTATSDGGCIAGGSVDSDPGGSVDCYNEGIQAILVKLNANGEQEWQKCYGGSNNEQIGAILEVDDGYIVTANTNSDDFDLDSAGYHLGYDKHGNRLYDIWIYKIDKNGNKLWGKCFGGSKDEFDQRLLQTSTGDIIVFGRTKSLDGDITNNHHGFGQFEDIWMLKLSGEGDLLWQRCIGTWGDQSIEKGVVMLDDYNFVVAANTTCGGVDDISCGQYPEISPYEDAWVFSITDSAGISGIGYQEFLTYNIKLYPNPAHDFTTVEIPPNYKLQNAYAEIIDASGRMRDSFKVNEKQFVINVSGYQKGIYMIRIYDERGIITKKFIVE